MNKVHQHVDNERVIRLIKDRMAERSLSLRKLAPQVGVTASYLSLILRGERPMPSTKIIPRLAEVLSIDPNLLFIEADRVPVKNPKIKVLFRKLATLTDRDLQKVQKLANSLVKEHDARTERRSRKARK